MADRRDLSHPVKAREREQCATGEKITWGARRQLCDETHPLDAASCEEGLLVGGAIGSYDVTVITEPSVCVDWNNDAVLVGGSEAREDGKAVVEV